MLPKHLPLLIYFFKMSTVMERYNKSSPPVDAEFSDTEKSRQESIKGIIRRIAVEAAVRSLDIEFELSGIALSTAESAGLPIMDIYDNIPKPSDIAFELIEDVSASI